MAIGDGSNDVAMIHTAHIGIGLYGLEGSEASSSADYALCEFKQTRRLLFYHGMHIGAKLRYFIELICFRSTIFALCSLFFCNFNGISGMTTWTDLYYAGFNLYLVTVPICAWFILDQLLPIDGKS